MEVKYDPNGKSMIVDADENGGGGGAGITWDLYVNFAIPPDGTFIYDPDSGSLFVYDKDGNRIGTIDLPVEAQNGFNSESTFTYTIADKDGNVYKLTKGEDGNVRAEKVVTSENPQDNNNSNIDVEKTKEKVKTLVDSLIINIKTKLNNSNDQMFQLSYRNVADLKNIVTFDMSVGSGGQHINKRITIGRAGVTEGENTDGSDGDIMSTFFHEYIHYICFISNIFPVRYMYSVEEGVVYSEMIPIGEELEDETAFMKKAYDLFIYSNFNTDIEKYSSYPDNYGQLNGEQRKELDEYIKEKGLIPEVTMLYEQYVPSNHAQNELNAHNKTLEAASLELFIMSNKKLIFYDKEIKRYQKMYDFGIKVEREYNYTPSGQKK